MSFRGKIMRLLSGAVSSAMLLSMSTVFSGTAPYLSAEAASACTINTNKTYQTIRGFGGMNLPEWQGYDLTDAQVQTAFGTGNNQLGLTVLRIYVSDDARIIDLTFRIQCLVKSYSDSEGCSEAWCYCICYTVEPTVEHAQSWLRRNKWW